MRIRSPSPRGFATANRSAMNDRSYSSSRGSSRFHGADISMRVTPIAFRSAAQILNVARSRQGFVQSHRSNEYSRFTGRFSARAKELATETQRHREIKNDF